ncbi:hypothetical protein JCM5353_002571, partial [Sporobolomyces roseus]
MTPTYSTQSSTPIHAQYSTPTPIGTPTPSAKPLIVPSLPPRPLFSTLPFVNTNEIHESTDALAQLTGAEMIAAASTGEASHLPLLPSPPPVSSSRAPQTEPEEALEDGPLFRAHLSTLEKRAASLRSALKRLGKAVEANQLSLRESFEAHAHIDEVLEDLSGGGGLAGGENILGQVYERSIRNSRDRKRLKAERELERGREFGERLKSSVDGLKLVEERRKSFESESKRFYEDLAKYLAKVEPDSSKIAHADAKQGERTDLFRVHRIEYFSFVEGIVASEEHAVAAWMQAWENVVEHGVGDDSVSSSREGWVHLEQSGGGKCDLSAHAQLLDALNLDSDPGSPALTASGSASANGRPAPSRSSTLDLPPPISPAHSQEYNKDAKRRRRTSLPHWGLSPSPSVGAEKEGGHHSGGGRRDRLKGFIKSSLTSAQNSLQSALPSSSSSHNLFSPTSEGFPHSPPASSAPHTPPISHEFRSVSPIPTSSSTHLLPPPSSVPLRSPANSTSNPRKKEGFLYATEVGQKHSTAGDGGAKYNRYWVVLSEGQLVEYDRWTDSLSVHGVPINLRYATARISKQAGDRRFCFEVLTPQLRRVYQATSEKECTEWVAGISKSVESLLNGTSSVRHFDSSRINGNEPYSNDYSSSLSLATDGKQHSHDSPLTSPKGGRFGPFLSRHTSLGHARKVSGSGKKDKRRSVQQQPTVPSFRIGEEDSPSSDRTYFDPSSRRGVFALSEGSDLPSSPSRPMLDGLGIPFGGPVRSALSSHHPASRSSPNLLVPRSRTGTSPSDGFSTGDEGD